MPRAARSRAGRRSRSITPRGWPRAGGDRLEGTVETIAPLAPGVARVTGRTRLTPSDGSVPCRWARFAALFIKCNGRWLFASVREVPNKELSPHEHLEELEWLVGDWVEESEDAVVLTSIAWSENGTSCSDRSTSGSRVSPPDRHPADRLGPLTKQIKSWVFDSRGGYGEGLWMRQGDQWIIKATGVRPTARATATQVLTYVNKDTLRWKSIDRTLGERDSAGNRRDRHGRKPPQPK